MQKQYLVRWRNQKYARLCKHFIYLKYLNFSLSEHTLRWVEEPEESLVGSSAAGDLLVSTYCVSVFQLPCMYFSWNKALSVERSQGASEAQHTDSGLEAQLWSTQGDV